MQAGKTTLIDFGSNLVISAAGFAATFAIAYLLGPTGLGEYAIATAVGFFWLAIPGNAVGAAINKRISEGSNQAAYFGTGLGVNGILGVILAGLVLLIGELAPLVIDPVESEFIRVIASYNGPIAVLILGTYVFRTILGGLQGNKRVATAGILRAIERIGRTMVQAGVLFLGYGVSALIFGHAISLIVTAAAGFLLLGFRPKFPKREHIDEVAAFAKYAWMGALRSRVFGWMDTILLSIFVSASLIGVYEAAWGIATLLATISSSIQRTLFPEISDLSTGAEFERIRQYLADGLVFAGVFVIPGLVGASIVGQRVLEFYGPEFGRGSGILILLVLAYGFDVYASQFVNVINAIDSPDVAYRVNFSFIVVNFVLNLILIWVIGWYGAAIATAVSALLRVCLGYFSLRRLIGQLRLPVREIGCEIIAAVSMGLLVIWIEPFAMAGRLGTLQLVSAGAISYVLILLSISVHIRQKALYILGGGTG